MPEEHAASLDDIGAAVEALQPADWTRLHSYARHRMAGLSPAQLKGRRSADLLSEAIKRTAAGERRWRQEVPFVHFLLGVMRSISTAWRHEANPEPTVAVANLPAVADLEKVVRSAEGIDRAAPDPYQFTLARENVAAIREHFKDDTEVSLIIDGLGEGLEVKEIAVTLGLDQKSIDTALKRMRRHVRSLIPDWRPR